MALLILIAQKRKAENWHMTSIELSRYPETPPARKSWRNRSLTHTMLLPVGVRMTSSELASRLDDRIFRDAESLAKTMILVMIERNANL
jgi:hypothetical protein